MAIRFGEYLIKEGVINESHLEDSLSVQNDNKELKIGEILVAQGHIGREELLQYIQNFINDTGANVEEVTEWLSQSEADALILKLKAESEF